MTYTFTIPILVFDNLAFTALLVFVVIILVVAVYKWIASLIVGG